MSINDSEIKLYVDMMIVESLVDNTYLIKEAGIGGNVMSLMTKIKDYFASKIDPDNKAESVINLISPGAISVLFSTLGHPWIGGLLALAQQVFKVNVGGLLMSIYESVKGIISSGFPTTSQNIDDIVSNAVKSNSEPVTDDDERAALDRIRRNKSGSYDVKQQMRDVRLVKLAIIEFQEGILEKNASWIGGLTFGLLQGKIISILIKFFGIIIKIALASAGFIVAGDVINKFIGGGSSDSGASGGGFTSSLIGTPSSVYVSKQTKFPRNPAYSDIKYNTRDSFWAEGFVNNYAGISDMLIQFAKEVYTGLNGLEDLIRSLPTFQEVVRVIEQFNRTATGSSVVYLPKMFTSKKQIVDLFIDDVAQKVQ